MKTAEYLEMALTKRARGVNAELARMLGIARSAITHYQTGHRIMDDYTASKVAEVLGIDEMELIALANAEREKDPEKRAYWEGKAKTAREKREPLEVVASLGIEPRTRGFS
ncbi:helix-turn-helix domain-containing protein, partial [Thiobacillus thioparus]|uniref:helix-turn-helix domain-containing protein n=1 Tax=Thiobacillus thioparus TaxID=931 RepID=UPI000379754A